MTQGYLRSYESIGGGAGDPPFDLGKIKIKVIRAEHSGEVEAVDVYVDFFDRHGQVKYALPAQRLLIDHDGATLTLELPK